MGTTRRIHALDGIRGVAALVVVFYHLTLVAQPFIDPVSWAWLTQSPLKILTIGTESVLVFFVLSGLVVALPTLRDGFSWLAYYPHRLLRLYLPVIASLVLAAVLIAVFPRDPAAVAEGSWLRDAQASEVSLGRFLLEGSLYPASYDINNVLWSLRWEVIFSLALPAFVGLALALRKHGVALAAACCGLTVLGRVLQIDALVYLPVFMLGTVMALNLERILEWSARVQRPWLWPALAALAGLLMIASQLAQPLFGAESLGNELLWGLAGIGAAIVILLGIAWPRLRAKLESRPIQWLGRISFSLYLVHAPILGTLGFLFGDGFWWAVGPVGVPLSLAVAALFHRWVESPTQRLGRFVGRGVARAAAPARPRTTEQPERSSRERQYT
ncbi:acyltransferase family protein [Agromyces laixinhei]|uniref:acyltransferase family protein n=1 Tax=Agromyces laixinhei TaxID=2585717 RepID=UPI0012ED1163|nr:acyltransferase [Agromyces laixinhei]